MPLTYDNNVVRVVETFSLLKCYEYSVSNIQANPKEGVFLAAAREMLGSGLSITPGAYEYSIKDGSNFVVKEVVLTRKLNIRIVF